MSAYHKEFKCWVQLGLNLRPFGGATHVSQFAHNRSFTSLASLYRMGSALELADQLMTV